MALANGGHSLPKEEIERLGVLLNDGSRPLKARFRALFALRNVGTNDCVEWIGAGLTDDSALLKHELAYCLGQMQNPTAIPILVRTLEDENQEPIVRHEAGEALGAIGDPLLLDILEKYTQDDQAEVAQTCDLALRRIQYKIETGDKTESPYDSVDPTPSFTSTNVSELANVLLDESRSLWDRYRSMFALRNLKTKESIEALAQGLYCESSALFRHEVAYVLGQLQSELTIKQLTDRLKLPTENSMVRHECAEALGAIATPECFEILKEYRKDPERVVRESCEVALDMADYEVSQQFQYANPDR